MTLNQATRTQEVLTQKAQETIFTPSEALAPNPLVHRAMNARLEALLMKHEPDTFSAWRSEMERRGEGRGVNRFWGIGLSYIAAGILMERRGDWEWNPDGPQDAKKERRLERCRLLIVRLVYRGCKKRGEC